MRILICGGAGFIGRNLTTFFLREGHDVIVLDRNKSSVSSPRLQSFEGDLLKPELYQERWFDGIDSVINLSGKDIFTLWTAANRKMIWDSRVTVNKNLVDFISKLDRQPGAFISASAVGYYGNRGEESLTEESHAGQGFLSEICKAWESEAQKAENFGIRSVQVRTAPVLLKTGGILGQLRKSIRFGFTFRFNGDQWLSWMHMTDLLRVYLLAATDETLRGPVNAGSPDPVRFRDFLSALTRFEKAIVIPLPAALLKLVLGEASQIVLFSERMVPLRLLQKDFRFDYPKLSTALEDLYHS